MNDDEPVGPIGEIAAKRKSVGLPTYPSHIESKQEAEPLAGESADSGLAGTLIKGFGWTVVIAVGVLAALILHDEYLKYQLGQVLNGKR